MEVRLLPTLTELEQTDLLVVGRYVNGLFKPFNVTAGVIANTLTMFVSTIALTDTTPVSVSVGTTIITNAVTSAQVQLPLLTATGIVTIVNRSSFVVDVVTNGQTINEQSSASINANTSATLFYPGNNTWFAV